MRYLKNLFTFRNTAALWKLTVGDFIFKGNEDILCSFGSIFSNDHIKGSMLAGSWGARDRKSMIRVLHWLEHEGHSFEYEQELRNPSSAFYERFIETHGEVLKDKSLRAWDLGRLSTQARLGVTVGYISEEEFWEFMDRVGPVLQGFYSSWHDFADQYVLGRSFWNETLNDPTPVVRHAHAFLTKNPRSPWRMAPWSTDLSKRSPYPISDNNPYYFDYRATGEKRNAALRKHYQHVIKIDPNANVFNSYGTFLEETEGYGPANEYYLKSINAGAFSDMPFSNLIDGLHQMYGNDKEKNAIIENNILTVYAAWVEKLPDSDDAHAGYATWLMENHYDCDEKIERHFIRSLEINDRNKFAHYKFAKFLMKRRGDIDWSLRHYGQALELDPHNQEYRDALVLAEKIQQEQQDDEAEG